MAVPACHFREMGLGLIFTGKGRCSGYIRILDFQSGRSSFHNTGTLAGISNQVIFLFHDWKLAQTDLHQNRLAVSEQEMLNE